MSGSAGPSIQTDGLVFDYDMSNTQKSFKGAPTTNLVTYPEADWNGSSFALTYDYKGNGVGNATQTFDTSVETPLGNYSGVMKYTTGSAGITTYPDGYKYWAIRISGLTAGVTYTFSYYAKASIASNFSNSQLWRDTGTDYGPSGDWNPTFTTEWRRYSTTRVMVGTYLDYFPIHSGNLTGGHTIYYWGFQMEVGSFATPFVVGTRSSTQALLDLTGGNTITASNLAYASDNTFSFNGTTNELHPTINHSYLSSSALEVIFRSTSHGSGYKTIFGYSHNNGYSRPTIGSLYLENNTLSASVITASQVYRTATVAGNINTNTYYHVVLNKNTTTGVLDIYVNGVLSGTQTFDAATYGQWTVAGSFIGSNLLDIGKSTNTNSAQGWSTDFFNGVIPVAKIYNRALSAAEVQQNFNALRTRYGI